MKATIIQNKEAFADMRIAALMLLLTFPFVGNAQEFKPLFNGKDLTGWRQDTPGVWRVVEGVIIGKTQGLMYNDFLRSERRYSNFVLKAKMRLIGGKGNSGIQFRSEPVPNSHEVSGYQADAANGIWGALYDESRRNRMLGTPAAAIKEEIDGFAWHEYTITAKGNRIRLELDGVVTVDYVEADPTTPKTGFLALQVHGSREPVEVHFKDLMIKEFD